MSESLAANRELGTVNVRKLVVKYSLAAVIGQFGQLCQVTSDGFFVGNGIGSNGLATIAICVTLLSFAMSIGCLIAIGGTSLAAIELGENNREQARAIFGQCVWFGLILSVSIAIVGYLAAEPLAIFFGASEPALIASCVDYIHRYFIFFPFYVFGCIFYFFVRLDEKPFLGTLALTVPVVYAAIIEYTMIFHLHCGMESSATAFGLTVGSWSLLGLYFLISKKTIFKVRLSDLHLRGSLIISILKYGFAACIIQLAVSFIAIIINNFLNRFNVPMETSAFGVLNAYIMYIFTLIVTLGFVVGLQPIASFNFGAKKYARIREALNITVAFSVVVMVFLTALVFLFKTTVIPFFAGDNTELVAVCIKRMYLYLGMFALGSVSFIVSGYYQAIGKNGLALLHSLTRNVIFIIPALFILTALFGLTGVWAAMPIADLLAFIVAAAEILRENKRLKQLT